jgi:hypothetical protein
MSEHDPLREDREAAAAFVKDLTATTGVEPSPLTREELVEVGKMAWEIGYKHTSDDEEAFNLMVADAQEGVNSRYPFDAARASSFLYLPAEQALIFWCARWADQGFPVIQMGHKYAAALMATAVTVDAEEIRPPFHAFLISVPSGLLSVRDPQRDKVCNVSSITVQRSSNSKGEYRWSYVIQAERVTLWRHGVFTHDMVEGPVTSESTSSSSGSSSTSAWPWRAPASPDPSARLPSSAPATFVKAKSPWSGSFR